MSQPMRKRGPGFSRRAQYNLFFGYVVAVAGVLVALGMIVIAHVDPQGFALVRGAALDLTAPISGAGRDVVRGVSGAVDGVAAYVDAGSKNRAMAAELAHDRAALVQARILAFENARLRRMLRLTEQNADPVATARIVGSTSGSSRRLATLNAGSRDGVRPGQPVRSPEGLVGRVLETGLIASRVLLVTDNASVVPVRLARGGLAALAAGRGDGTIELRPLGAGANPFHRGDIVLTSGTGGLYPPDVPVAVVIRREGDVAVGWPLADPAKLDYAIVEPPYVGLPPAPPAPAPARPCSMPSSAPPTRAIEVRAAVVPVASTIAASATALVPAVTPVPVLPPLGLLTLLGWRLLRPELWGPWMGLPLGLADDLVSGQTLGTGMVTWTLCLLLVDAVEGRLLWRDYWQEWLLAAALIAFAILGGWAIARWTGGEAPVTLVLPQIAASILCFPIVGRLCAILDRWRLAIGKIRPVS